MVGHGGSGTRRAIDVSDGSANRRRTDARPTPATGTERRGPFRRPTRRGRSGRAADDTGDGAPATLIAEADDIVVVFRPDPDAPITRQGTIGR